MAIFDDFIKLDIRVGTIIEAKVFEKAKKPAYKLKVDFNPKYIKNSFLFKKLEYLEYIDVVAAKLHGFTINYLSFLFLVFMALLHLLIFRIWGAPWRCLNKVIFWGNNIKW